MSNTLVENLDESGTDDESAPIDLAQRREEIARRRRAAKSRRERDRLVQSQLKLADKIAHDYRNKGVELDDLRQVAYLALTRAAERYDESHGTRFSVYASVSINGEIKRYFRDHGWSVRPPRSVQELYLKVRSAQDRATQSLARTPTVDELAEATDLDREQVLVAMDAQSRYRSRSIDTPADPERTSHVFEPVAEEEGFDRVCEELDLERLIAPLSARQRRILEMRFRDECTQATIAEEIGVSQVQVSRLLSRIIDTMRAEAERMGEKIPA